MGAVIGGALLPSASILGKNARASGEAYAEYGMLMAGEVTVPSGLTPEVVPCAEAAAQSSAAVANHKQRNVPMILSPIGVNVGWGESPNMTVREYRGFAPGLRSLRDGSLRLRAAQ
jgi:hypothetical protein